MYEVFFSWAGISSAHCWRWSPPLSNFGGKIYSDVLRPYAELDPSRWVMRLEIICRNF